MLTLSTLRDAIAEAFPANSVRIVAGDEIAFEGEDGRDWSIVLHEPLDEQDPGDEPCPVNRRPKSSCPDGCDHGEGPPGPRIVASGGFNTGRLYTRHGQRIYWHQCADGWLYFRDVDRMVDGWLKRQSHDLAEPIRPRWLVDAYDRGMFAPSVPGDHRRQYLPEFGEPDGLDYGDALRI